MLFRENTVAGLQSWLNARGAALTVDGKGGPATRAALIQTFANRNATPMRPGDFHAMAARLGATGDQLRAVGAVESGGSFFLPSGLPKILWERHYFWKRIQIKIPLISDPAPGGYTLDADKDGINDSWEKLAEAACRNPVAAFESCSWGGFQVMGAHWKRLGYASAPDFAWSFTTGEQAHYEALSRYIEANGMLAAIQRVSTDPETNRAFAQGYNGTGYKKFAYHVQIAEAMRRAR